MQALIKIVMLFIDFSFLLTHNNKKLQENCTDRKNNIIN